MFALEFSAEVERSAAARDKAQASARKGPVQVALGSPVQVSLHVPPGSFDLVAGDDEAEVIVWNGTHDTAQFVVMCLHGAELRRHICRAVISVSGKRRATLCFELHVIARKLSSPPGTPPAEMEEMNTQELALFPSARSRPQLAEGKKYHFFVCHHQGSGGDQAYLLSKFLEDRGYSVWYDNSREADRRNLQGMRDGVVESECLLIFLSGRKETDGLADPANGVYEGPFTRCVATVVACTCGLP